ncbi:MAG: Ig-like domain-containing protein [Clostridia bacterium]|nr:Ig-like domain-containing protein [Clostridia bacterium]
MKGISSHINSSGFNLSRINAKFKRNFVCLLLALAMPVAAASADTDYTSVEEKPSVTYSICSLRNLPVSFSTLQMEKRMGLENNELSGVIITQLPEASQGRLTIAGEKVTLYETIGREGLDALDFTPAKGCTQASFNFIPLIPNEDNKCAKMSIVLLDKPNSPPVVTADTLATQENMSIKGSLCVQDEDTSTVKIRVTQQSVKGSINFNGLSYTYDPYLGMTGNDSFTCAAVDRYGAVSQSVKINIAIEKPQTSLTYADMNGDANYYAAVKLAQMGVIVGEQVGSSHLFYPARVVTKGEFLVMLIAVTGKQSELSPTVNTGLSNDSNIPMWLKAYVEKAERDGILGGAVGAKSYECAAPVTDAEAVVMMSRAAQISDSTRAQKVFCDAATIPSWAMQSYLNLYGNGIPVSDGDCARPLAPLTRSRAAGMLWRLYCYCRDHDQDLELN